MTLKFIHININIWQSLRIVSVRAQEVLTLTMRELRHWPSIAGMSPQSHCGDEEDGCIELSS